MKEEDPEMFCGCCDCGDKRREAFCVLTEALYAIAEKCNDYTSRGWMVDTRWVELVARKALTGERWPPGLNNQ